MTDKRRAVSYERCEAIAEPPNALRGEPERTVVDSNGASSAICRPDLEHLSRVADSLVLLAPEIDPPVGFEMLVVERMQAAPSWTGVLDGFDHEQHWSMCDAPTRSER
jgi:hypothetical protein